MPLISRHSRDPITLAVEASGQPNATMCWTMVEGSKDIQQIMPLYYVKLCRWPADIDFKPPSALNVGEAKEVLAGFREGLIYFRKLGPETLTRVAKEQMGSTLAGLLFDAGRVDKFSRRAPRGEKTRSKKRIRQAVKTTEEVPDDYL